MEIRTKIIRLEIPKKLEGTSQIFPLLSPDIRLTLSGIRGLKDIKFKEIFIVYTEKYKKFKGF